MLLSTPLAAPLGQPAGSLAQADALVAEADAIWGRDTTRIAALLDRALAIREARLGAGHLLVAEVVAMIGRNAWNGGDYPAAERSFRRALSMEQARRPGTVPEARLMGDLGAAIRELGRCAEAEPLVRRSLDRRAELAPPTHPWRASGHDNLARVLVCLCRDDEALEEAEKALAIRRTGDGAGAPATRLAEALVRAIRERLARPRPDGDLCPRAPLISRAASGGDVS